VCLFTCCQSARISLLNQFRMAAGKRYYIEALISLAFDEDD
jgi:hypothetical protein